MHWGGRKRSGTSSRNRRTKLGPQHRTSLRKMTRPIPCKSMQNTRWARFSLGTDAKMGRRHQFDVIDGRASSSMLKWPTFHQFPSSSSSSFSSVSSTFLLEFHSLPKKRSEKKNRSRFFVFVQSPNRHPITSNNSIATSSKTTKNNDDDDDTYFVYV